MYGLAIRCLTVRPPLQSCYYIVNTFVCQYILVPVRGLEPRTHALSRRCSTPELNRQYWHPLKDSNLGMSESKSDALDQLGEEGIVWRPARDSNSDQGFWRPTCCHYTSETLYYLRTVANACIEEHSLRHRSPGQLYALRYSTFLHTSVIATGLPSGRTPSFAV